MSSNFVNIVEVGARDGLQNEKRLWSPQERIELIRLLAPCGFKEIEVGSFVSPKWVPQMADTGQVYAKLKDVIKTTPKTLFSALVPNESGMNQAIQSGIKDISIFTAASESFSLKNTNCTIEESFLRFEPILLQAQQLGIHVRGYVSCVVECPYEGPIDPYEVAKVVRRLYNMGCREISLGDTIGKGNPESMHKMILTVKDHVPVESLAIHCHDTFGNALENIIVCLEAGVRTVDSSVYGLGGCPYGGADAKGNVATEVVVKALPTHGYEVGINVETLEKAIEYVRTRGGREVFPEA